MVNLELWWVLQKHKRQKNPTKTCFEKQAFQPIIKNETTTVRRVTSALATKPLPTFAGKPQPWREEPYLILETGFLWDRSSPELMLLNCGVGEETWESLELQDQTSQS